MLDLPSREDNKFGRGRVRRDRDHYKRGIELTHISTFEVTEWITAETITAPGGRDTEREHIYRHTCG